MVKLSWIPGRSIALASMSLLVAAVFAVTWAAPAAGAGRAFPEAPMQVATEGMTAEQHLQRQADLARWLAGELPPAARDGAVHIAFTPEEVAAIDQASRFSTPLAIGIVKPLIPAIDIDGLDRGASSPSAHRGVTGRAYPTEDGGLCGRPW